MHAAFQMKRTDNCVVFGACNSYSSMLGASVVASDIPDAAMLGASIVASDIPGSCVDAWHDCAED